MPLRALDRLTRFCTILGALAIGVMMLATCWDILARSLANRPLHGVVELVEVMVLASAMLGLPESFLRNQQIQVDLIDGFVPASVLKLLKVTAAVLAVTLLAILAVNIYQPMLDAHRFGDIKYDIRVPVYPLYGLIIFCFVVSIASCLAALLRELGTKDH